MRQSIQIENRDGEHIATLFKAVAPKVPVLVNVPHSGEQMPTDVDELIRDLPGLRSEMLQDVDRFVDRIWRDSPASGASFLVARMSRYAVDLNRAGDDVSDEVVHDATPKRSPGYYGERGVLWARTTRRTPVWRRRLQPSEFDQRIARFHTPYHQSIEEILSVMKAEFGKAILVDAHSMPSAGRAGHADEGRLRPDINPGTLMGTSCCASIRSCVESHLREAGLEVRTDDPYKGGWITRHYGRPHEGVHAIQIEINRQLYMDETSCKQKNEAIARLGCIMVGLIPKLARLSRNAL